MSKLIQLQSYWKECGLDVPSSFELGGGVDMYKTITDRIMNKFTHGLFDKPNPILMQHFRGNELIDEDILHNGITTAGKTAILNVAFDNASVITPWYFGLIDNSGFTALADTTDTMASHSGWSEFTGYTQTTRPAWGNGAASAASITNASAVLFSINTSGTLYGMFVVSQNTIGGTTGTLWATAGFSVTKPVLNGDSVNLTYTLSC